MGIEGEKGLVQVLDGLKPGDLVVTSGQFLLDAESRTLEATRKFLTSTVWEPDGAARALDVDDMLVPQLRLHVAVPTEPVATD